MKGIKVIEVLAWAKRCKVSSKTSDFIKLELIKFYENKRLSLLNFLEKFSKNEKIFPSLIFYFEKLSTSLEKVVGLKSLD